jgi:myotubularin-related protein 6/7/8
MVGLKNARSIQDEKLIEAIFRSHSQHTVTPSFKSHITAQADLSSSTESVTIPVYGATATNLIIDARPTANAMVNSVRGAGSENMEYYKNCKKAYLGVDNIHIMRDSLKALVEGALRRRFCRHIAPTAHRTVRVNSSP